MNKFIFHEYVFITLATYAVRVFISRSIFFIKPINNFYKKRQVFPAVKIWNNKFLGSIYREFFSLLEVSIITIIYMLVESVIATNFILLKGAVFFIFYATITVTSKVKFAVISTEYPSSLLIFDILISSVIIFFECIVIALLYG